MMTLAISRPQQIFLKALKTKYKAYVGGFGCVHPETKIHTEHGLIRICDIDRPMRVLSWNETNQQFQLSLSGGAYPKGKANLYRVATQLGEFVASEHHRSLCADGTYQRVDLLRVGDELKTCDLPHVETNQGLDLSALPVGDQHCSQILEGLMGDYADEARLYGLRLLEDQAFCQDFAQLQVYAHKSDHSYGLSGYEGIGLECSRLDLLTFRLSMMGFRIPFAPLEIGEANQKPSLSSEHTSRYHREREQFLLKSFYRHKGQQSFVVDGSFGSSCIKTAAIVSIERLECESSYWDMQVLDTNNYVTEDGAIHHNSGKTYVGCLDLIDFAMANPGTVQGYFGVSYPSIRDIFYPTFEEAAESRGFRVKINEGHKEVHLYWGRRYYGTIICRSMEKPNTIVGFKIARALVDEIDTLPKQKAENAWNKIVARLRLKIDGVVNGIGVTTTPEGFLFVYSKFKDEPTQSYSMVQASTYENERFLPDDYIETLIETYPAGLIEAYLKGEFVNLTAGSVYPQYDRLTNNSFESIQPYEPLIVGLDFNVGKMAACIYVQRGKDYHCVEEITQGRDTEYVAQILKDRYVDKGHRVTVYPDASGKNTSSKGHDKSDISILEQHGLYVVVRNVNPRVRNRVNAVNKAFQDRRVFINSMRCPETAKCIEQQPYDVNGEPDKKNGLDHQSDAFGYPICHLMPVEKPLLHEKIRMSR